MTNIIADRTSVQFYHPAVKFMSIINMALTLTFGTTLALRIDGTTQVIIVCLVLSCICWAMTVLLSIVLSRTKLQQWRQWTLNHCVLPRNLTQKIFRTLFWHAHSAQLPRTLLSSLNARFYPADMAPFFLVEGIANAFCQSLIVVALLAIEDLSDDRDLPFLALCSATLGCCACDFILKSKLLRGKDCAAL